MQQFYDIPEYNRRSQLQLIFQQEVTPRHNQQRHSDFQPFQQERDKLGRLLPNPDASTQIFYKRRSSSTQLPPTKLINNPQNSQETNRQKTIQKVFKLNGVKGLQNSGNLHKLSIRNFLNCSETRPSTSYQKYASLKDRVESMQKQRASAIKSNVSEPRKKKKRAVASQEKALKYLPFPESAGGTKQTIKTINSKNKVELNIPELQRFNAMKSLKTKVVQNFEDNHLRFKQLVRKSLILANNIKRGLEFD